MLSYLPSLGTILLAVMQLAKDWGAHQSHWRRATVLVAIGLLGVGGLINTFYSSRKSNQQHNDDEARISRLEAAVETSNKNQQDNTKQFVKSFADRSEKVAFLQTQVKSEGLQKEAAQLRSQLEATQKALVPPKATLGAC